MATNEEDLIRMDLLRAAEEPRQPLAPVDDPLEEDLEAAGFYGPPQTKPSTAQDAVRALGDMLSWMRQQAIEDRWAQDNNTLLNFAFKNGHHYVEVDRARRAVMPLPAPRGLVRRTIDKFAPWYRAQHSKLVLAEPKASIVPKTPTLENRDAAAFAEELREWVYPKMWSFSNRSEHGMWVLLGGISVMYAGVEYDRPDEAYFQATSGPEGAAMMHRPNLVFRVHSPFEVWTDNRASQVKNMRWIGVDQFMAVSEARALYLEPENQQNIVPIGSDTTETGFHTLREAQRMMGMSDPWQRPASESGPKMIDEEDETVVAEFWGREGLVMQGAHLHGLAAIPGLGVEVLDDGMDTNMPLVRFTKGVKVCFAPEGWIFQLIPNEHGFLPFREIKASQSAGFWTPAWATPLREINHAIDWVVSLGEQHLWRTSHPILLEPTQARMHRRGGMLGALQRFIYDANRYQAEPKWMALPNSPSDRVLYLQELERIWMDIAGQHEVSQGRLPTRLSGVAVALLQEQDTAQLGYAGSEMESAFGDVLKMALQNVQKFFPDNDPRLLKLAGDAPFRLRSFMLADLEDDLSVQVQEGSALPRSPAAVKAEAMELWEAGALVDDLGRPDVRKLKLAFGQGSREDLYFEDDLDLKNAREEEDLILSMTEDEALLVLELYLGSARPGADGAPEMTLIPPLNTKLHDNDIVHERSHRLREKQIAHDVRIPDAVKQVLEFHRLEHVRRSISILMQIAPEVVAPILSQTMGAPGGPGGEEEDEEGSSDSPPKEK